MYILFFFFKYNCFTSSLGGKEFTCNKETRIQSLGQEDLLEKGMTTHSSILAWQSPWTEKPGGLQWGCKELDMTETTNTQDLDLKRHELPKNGCKVAECMYILSTNDQSSQILLMKGRI